MPATYGAWDIARAATAPSALDFNALSDGPGLWGSGTTNGPGGNFGARAQWTESGLKLQIAAWGSSNRAARRETSTGVWTTWDTSPDDYEEADFDDVVVGTPRLCNLGSTNAPTQDTDPPGQNSWVVVISTDPTDVGVGIGAQTAYQSAFGHRTWGRQRTLVAPTLPAIADVSWTAGVNNNFFLPEATGTNPIVYTVTGLPAGVTFVESTRRVQGTATTAGSSSVIYQAVDADGAKKTVAFTFVVSQATISTTTRPWKVEIDWDGDGSFANAHADISEDILTISTCKRGRDYSSHFFGRSLAGVFQCRLRNDTDIYNRFNENSDLSGLVVPGRLVRVYTVNNGVARQEWGGVLDELRPVSWTGGRKVLNLRALGYLSLLRANEIDVGMQTGVTIATAGVAVLDAAGLPAARRGTIAGTQTMPRWWVQRTLPIRALRDLEETGLGFLYEQRMGLVSMAIDSARSTGSRNSVLSLKSTGTLADEDVPVLHLQASDPVKDMVNKIRVRVRQFTVADTAETLWEVEDIAQLIESGESFTWTALYPSQLSSGDAVGVTSWENLTATTDYSANSVEDGTGADRTSSLTAESDNETANSRDITITNGHASGVYITRLATRGTKVTEDDPLEYPYSDAASIVSFGEREYFASSVYLSLTQAEQFAPYIVNEFKDPYSRITVTFEDAGNEHPVDLSNRVTVDAEDYYVENIDHEWPGGDDHEVTLVLSPTSIGEDLNAIVLGTGPALGTGTLGR